MKNQEEGEVREEEGGGQKGGEGKSKKGKYGEDEEVVEDTKGKFWKGILPPTEEQKRRAVMVPKGGKGSSSGDGVAVV